MNGRGDNKGNLIAILSLLVAIISLLFGENLYEKIKGYLLTETPPVGVSPLVTVSTINLPTTTIASTDTSLPTETAFPTDTATLLPTDTAFATDTDLATYTPLPITEIPPTEVRHLPDPTIVTTIQGGFLFCSKAILCGPRFEEEQSFHIQYSITQGNPFNTEFKMWGSHGYTKVEEDQGYLEANIPIDQWNAGGFTIWMINCNPEPITVEFSLSGGAWNRCE
jgi:hypothetical protein